MEELIGNESTVKRVNSILERPRGRPRSLLITGPIGCGKTTLARIIALTLTNGNDFDIYEMNSANYRGIDTIRELISGSWLMPLSGSPFKVYILDEAASLTPDAQRASLNLLEEPPKHVYLILCTNEPQKLSEAVRSRCAVFELAPLSDREILDLLKGVIAKEDVPVSSDILKEIVREAKGVPREALRKLSEYIPGREEQAETEKLTVIEEKKETIRRHYDKVFILPNRNEVDEFRYIISEGEQVLSLPFSPEDLRGSHAVIIQEKSEEGRCEAEQIAKDIRDIAKSVRVIEVPGTDNLTFGDWMEVNLPGGFVHAERTIARKEGRPYLVDYMADGLREWIDRIIEKPEDLEYPSLYTVPDQIIKRFKDFEKLELPEPRTLMAPWLREGTLVLISSDAGVGKTFLATEIAAGCAEGRGAMNGLWTVEKPVPVFYVDGEMEPHDTKTLGWQLDLDRCFIISKMVYESKNWPTRLNLMDAEIREFFTDQIERYGVKLLILDNLFSLAEGLDLNDFKEWYPINAWLLRLRLLRVAVILIHHTGKGGSQLGTASRAFNVDYSLILKKCISDGIDPLTCSFTIRIDKSRRRTRGITGKAFICDDGIWEVRNISESVLGTKSRPETEDTRRKIALMLVKGERQKNIAENLEKSASYVSQVKDRLIEKGLLNINPDRKAFELSEEGKKWLGEENN